MADVTVTLTEDNTTVVATLDEVVVNLSEDTTSVAVTGDSIVVNIIEDGEVAVNTAAATPTANSGWLGPFYIGQTGGSIPESPEAAENGWPGAEPSAEAKKHLWMPNADMVIVDYPENIDANGAITMDELIDEVINCLPSDYAESHPDVFERRTGTIFWQSGSYTFQDPHDVPGRVSMVGATPQLWFRATQFVAAAGGGLESGGAGTYMFTWDQLNGTANANFYNHVRDIAIFPEHYCSGISWGGAQMSSLDNVHVKRVPPGGVCINIRSGSNGVSVRNVQCWGLTPGYKSGSVPGKAEGARTAFRIDQYVRADFFTVKPESLSGGIAFDMYSNSGTSVINVFGAYSEGVGQLFRITGYGCSSFNAYGLGIGGLTVDGPDETGGDTISSPWVAPAVGVGTVIQIDNASDWIENNEYLELEGYGTVKVTAVSGNNITVEPFTEFSNPSIEESTSVPAGTPTYQVKNIMLGESQLGYTPNIYLRGHIFDISARAPKRRYWINQSSGSGGGKVNSWYPVTGDTGNQTGSNRVETMFEWDGLRPPAITMDATSTGVRSWYPAANLYSKHITVTSSASSGLGEVILRPLGLSVPTSLGSQWQLVCPLGEEQVVVNDTANAIQVYPHNIVGGAVDTIAGAGGVNQPFEVPPWSTATFTHANLREWTPSLTGKPGHRWDRTLTGSTTLDTDDDIVFCTGTFTVTLPDPADVPGKTFVVKNIGTGVITVDVSGGGTIDTVATQTIPAGWPGSYPSMQLYSYGTGYSIL